jgi:hypothetical protein
MSDSSQPKIENAAPRRAGILGFSPVHFLIFLAIFFVAAPFVEKLPLGHFLAGTLLTLALTAGVLAVSRTHKTLIVAVILAGPAVIGRWVHLFHPSLPQEIFVAPALVYIIFLIANLLLFILRASFVNAQVLCAGIATYLLLGMAWMFAYLLVWEWAPDSFSFTAGPDASHIMTGFTACYFSFITLTTVGYGDIVPASDIARMLTIVEATTGTLFMAVLIARLVSMHSSQPGTTEPKTPADVGTTQN